MNWLRSRVRTWLGIYPSVTAESFVNYVTEQRAITDALCAELDSFRSALKAKAAESRQRPVYTDYESSQVAVLEQFREPAKEN